MKEVIFEMKGHTGVITFNKPKTLNALCADFMAKIDEAIDQAMQQEDLFALVFTGTGRSFIAGADISEMYAKDYGSIYEWAKLGCNQNLRIEKLHVPTIAAINGYALGGGLELAMACDIRYAASTAKMGLPETSLGVISGAGGTQRLPRIVGKSMAKELIFTGRKIDAAEALRIGLVNRITEPDELMDAVFDLADEMARNGQVAVRKAKEVIEYSQHAPIEDGCIYERNAFSRLFITEDQKIGMGGFLRKEKNIQFKNR